MTDAANNPDPVPVEDDDTAWPEPDQETPAGDERKDRASDAAPERDGALDRAPD